MLMFHECHVIYNNDLILPSFIHINAKAQVYLQSMHLLRYQNSIYFTIPIFS